MKQLMHLKIIINTQQEKTLANILIIFPHYSGHGQYRQFSYNFLISTSFWNSPKFRGLASEVSSIIKKNSPAKSFQISKNFLDNNSRENQMTSDT